MKHIVLLLSLTSLSAHAAGTDKAGFVCPPHASLRALDGHYAHNKILQTANQLRSWPAILNMPDAYAAGVSIRKGRVHISQGWHERDNGDNCVRQDDKGLWVRESGESRKVHGPYQKLAKLTDDESMAYLTLFMSGCYTSSEPKSPVKDWCVSPKGITVNGKPFKGEFILDTMEFPEYGTSFVVGDDKKPLWVFAPTPTGWAVYADGYLSEDNHQAVVPGKTKPLFTLTPR